MTPNSPSFSDLFSGQLVRLTAKTADDVESFARWSADVEYQRLVDDDPVWPLSVARWAKRVDSESERYDPTVYDFMIRTLVDNVLIGFVAVHSIKWPSRSALISIGIGEKAFWGKGYGGEAMRLAVAYSFRELNLYRLGLTVLAYNERAIRLYEKVGFVREGAMRSAVERDGQRYDLLLMGLLRDEWRSKNGHNQPG